MKFAFLDFEFNGTAERDLNLVSASVRCYDTRQETYVREFWLYEGYQRPQAAAFFRKIISEGYIFVAYAMEAEARSLFTLLPELKPKDIQSIDLYLEYRCLLNHYNQYAYGSQLKDGKVVETKPPPPKWERVEDDDEDSHSKPSYSLSAACYKLLGTIIDTEEKDAVRRIIIDGDRGEIIRNMSRIQAYNMSDIRLLPQMLNEFYKVHRLHGFSKAHWLKAALLRGEYATRTAWMTRLGYPVNMTKVKAFTDNVAEIIKSAAEDCLASDPGVQSFRWNKSRRSYSVYEKPIKDWIKTQGIKGWRKTDKGQLSLSKDAFNDWFDSRSEGLAGAFCRYLKTKQSLNGFVPGGKKGRFTDYVGMDGRARPYFGIYGSQSSRSQPGSTGFIPLKAHWMRNFIEVGRGHACCGVDYSSQEFLIAATLSQDDVMIDAYASGDVYLAFAKAIGLVPVDATKKSHPYERDLCKTLILAISYDMSPMGLAARLTLQTKKTWTEGQATDLIERFYETYDCYKEWKDEIQDRYRSEGFLDLPDGWVMWGDNRNARSVGNFPVQGHGATIMRNAVRRAQDDGMEVIYTLHDALYIQYRSPNYSAPLRLKTHMADAFQEVMGVYGRTVPIRLDAMAWSLDYKDMPARSDGVLYLPEYVDEKGQADLERYRKFFTNPNSTKEMHHGVQESVREAELL